MEHFFHPKEAKLNNFANLPAVPKKLYMFLKVYFLTKYNVIEILQNFERVMWNHILVNIPNFKSIDAKLKKSYAEISCIRFITLPAKNENFDFKK